MWLFTTSSKILSLFSRSFIQSIFMFYIVTCLAEYGKPQVQDSLVKVASKQLLRNASLLQEWNDLLSFSDFKHIVSKCRSPEPRNIRFLLSRLPSHIMNLFADSTHSWSSCLDTMYSFMYLFLFILSNATNPTCMSDTHSEPVCKCVPCLLLICVLMFCGLLCDDPDCKSVSL